MTLNRPFIVLPKLINQPTWGGDYILKSKDWQNINEFKGKKIGQSYELFSGTKLLTKITSTLDKKFIGELGSADSAKIENNTGYVNNEDYIEISKATSHFLRLPLIKYTQSNGNSFQLHVKKDTEDKKWLAKPETWYYFEDGLVTFGIKKGIDLSSYKSTCIKIYDEMKRLSQEIKKGNITVDQANKKTKDLLKDIDPWQYVNQHVVKKGSIVDPSSGGIHHSWEEDLVNYPLGNVLYEVQRDVMDPIATIRSFDKGKFKSDGSIRGLNIDDYFKYLDLNPDHNDITKMTPKQNGNNLITTSHYRLDIIQINKAMTESTTGSFTHLFAKSGTVSISNENMEILLSSGHSCFIPETVKNFVIKPLSGESTLLKVTLP